MRVVYKYALDAEVTQTVSLPTGAIIRHVGPQNGVMQLWADVDPNTTDREDRTVMLAPSGCWIEDGMTYTNTIKTIEADIVLHVYVR